MAEVQVRLRREKTIHAFTCKTIKPATGKLVLKPSRLAKIAGTSNLYKTFEYRNDPCKHKQYFQDFATEMRTKLIYAGYPASISIW